ncbi:hypothetical protein F5B20DRAFT_147765 [Whalleya microplaca]|nr:hypothetical protein F5B20DRAFT_147765 [Whalleya microplaca]
MMDDQFNGRTDDDLFADDFEPVSTTTDVVQEEIITDDAASAAKSLPSASPAQESQAPQQAPAPTAPRSLAQSRHATKPAHQPRAHKRSPKPKPATTAAITTNNAAAAAVVPDAEIEGENGASAEIAASPSPTAAAASPTTPTAASPSATANAPTANATTATAAIKPGSNTALADRLASGANPRTKPTETELAAKMAQMRILAAEKTRKFEQAERDSRSHALAYERGMEEARRRREAEAEARRRGDEERRRLDAERAANRERKLRAMGAKESSWDDGKGKGGAGFEDERERRGGFRGANGGVRGVRSGIAGSRFAEREDGPVREFGADDFRGRGRGRGRGGARGGRGGGGRGAFGEGDRPAAHNGHGHGNGNGNGAAHKKENPVPPKPEDFPALPPGKKLDTTTTPASVGLPKLSPLSPDGNSGPIGKWDDEMAALDAKGA